MKSVQIRSYFRFIFSCIRTECRPEITPYLDTFHAVKVLCVLLQSKYIFAKNYHLKWTAGRANILCKHVIYIFLSFGCGFCSSFSMLFPKTPTSCGKKILKYFLLHCTSICMSSKSISQIFKILFQAGDNNIFVLRGVFFSRYV